MAAKPPAGADPDRRRGKRGEPAGGGPVDAAEILVGIPALNEERHIAACLNSLISGAVPGEEAEFDIVVADGGSRDGTRRIVREFARRYPRITLIDNPARLQSAALNRIVSSQARPRHRILVRCDAHAVYPPGYVLNVAQSLIRNDAAALATVLDATGRTCFQKAAAWAADSMLGSGGSGHRGGCRSGYVDHGHHAGFRLDRFRAIGGYDPEFSHNEDAELDYRLRRSGGRIWLDADLRIAYPMRAGPRSLARQYWQYGRGRARTIAKHRIGPKPRQLAPVANLILLVASVPAAALTPLFWVWPATYLAVLAAFSLWAAARHRALCGLWAGAALATMHTAWGAGFLSNYKRILNKS